MIYNIYSDLLYVLFWLFSTPMVSDANWRRLLGCFASKIIYSIIKKILKLIQYSDMHVSSISSIILPNLYQHIHTLQLTVCFFGQTRWIEKSSLYKINLVYYDLPLSWWATLSRSSTVSCLKLTNLIPSISILVQIHEYNTSHTCKTVKNVTKLDETCS